MWMFALSPSLAKIMFHFVCFLLSLCLGKPEAMTSAALTMLIEQTSPSHWPLPSF